MSPPTTIVSVTPMAVERDSRTFKQASSLSRLGYRSIVLEGEGSAMGPETLPFELLTVRGALPAWGSADVDGAPGQAVAAPPPAAPGPAVAPPEREPRVDPVRRIWRAWLGAWRVLVRARANAMPWLRQRTFAFRWQLGWNRRTLRSLPDADLYVLHGYPLGPAVLAKSLRTRSPIVYDAHDAYFDSASAPENMPGLRFWALVERLCVWRSGGFATVSEGVSRILEHRFGRRPIVIRNSHDLRLDREPGATIRETIGATDQEFVLVSIGNNKRGRAVDEALRALAQLPADVHLVLVGRGHEENLDQIAALGLEDRAHLVGPVPPTEVTGFVESADAALVLYRPLDRNHESALPNGFFQGICAGLPTIYPGALIEVARIAERHELGVPMDTGEPASMASAIAKLRDNPALLARLRENAARARQTENWEREESILGRLIETAMNGSAQ